MRLSLADLKLIGECLEEMLTTCSGNTEIANLLERIDNAIAERQDKRQTQIQFQREA